MATALRDTNFKWPGVKHQGRRRTEGYPPVSQTDLRDEFLRTLKHIDDLLTKITQDISILGILTDIEGFTIAEGLLLSAWTRWEQFTRYLLVEDLATSPTGKNS